MTDSLFIKLITSQLAIFVIVNAALLFLAHTGWRFGVAARNRNKEVAAEHSGSVQGAILGLLGLLLGFSFAMSVGRYDTRRVLAVDEANSIGTTWLRSSFLTDARHAESKALLREYTGLRLEVAKIPDDTAGLRRLFARANEIQGKLWEIADASITESPGPGSLAYVLTLNETIDLQTSRLAEASNHVPAAVWVLLVIVAGCGAWACGYGAGSGGHRSAFNLYVFPLLIGVVITIVADIDRPRKGLVYVSQQPLQDLYQSMEPAPAP